MQCSTPWLPPCPAHRTQNQPPMCSSKGPQQPESLPIPPSGCQVTFAHLAGKHPPPRRGTALLLAAHSLDCQGSGAALFHLPMLPVCAHMTTHAVSPSAKLTHAPAPFLARQLVACVVEGHSFPNSNSKILHAAVTAGRQHITPACLCHHKIWNFEAAVPERVLPTHAPACFCHGPIHAHYLPLACCVNP